MMTRIKSLKTEYFKQSLSTSAAFALALLVSEKIYSQTAQLDEIAVVGKSTRSTFTEVTPEEIADLKATIEKHTKYVNNKNGRVDPIVTMPPALETELYKVYERMTAEQRKKINYEGITMFRMPIPVKKAPTEEMFENWKRADIFGVWLNGKKIPNTALKQYSHNDIAEYDLSKLYGAALKGRSYKYQLDILTNEEFDRKARQ